MSVATTERPTQERGQLVIGGPRLAYHPALQDRFGVGKSEWKALCEAIFPLAQSVESIILALSYCKARKLDPFKRCVHIVPIYDKKQRCYVDTIWPGIGELRTTAFRTREYAGRGDTVFGEDLTRNVGKVEMTFPEWAQVTLYRMVAGQRVAFAGPRVYWMETYASRSHDDDTPNEMWATRPRGQIDKCAEAAALRAAFPEEIGSDYIPEEVQHSAKCIDAEAKPAVQSLDELTARITAKPEPEEQVAAAKSVEEPADVEPNPDDDTRDFIDAIHAADNADAVAKLWDKALSMEDILGADRIAQVREARRARVMELQKGKA